MERKKRAVIAEKKRINFNNPNLGKITPIAEYLDDHYESLSNENFCETNEIFITGNYLNAIDEKFRDAEFFKIHVHENSQFSENNLESDGSPRCKYVANGWDIERLTPKDIVQVITIDEIPNPNSRFISSDNLPSTSYIYLAATNSFICIGPFKWVACEGGYNINFIDAPFPVSKNLPNYHVFKFDASQFANSIYYTENYVFVYNMNDIHNKAEFYDYSSDENVVKYFIEQTNLCSLKNERTQLVALEAALKRNPKSHAKSPIFKKNFERLSEIVVDVEQAKDDISEGVQKFFKSESGLDIINSFVLKHEDKYLDTIKSNRKEEIEYSIQSKLDELQKLELQKQNFSNELNKLSREIEALKEQKETNNDEVNLFEKEEKLNSSLKIKIEQFDKLEADIKELSIQYSQLKSLSDLENEIKVKKSNRKFVEDEIDDLKKHKVQIQEQIQASNNELQKKLMDLKPYVDAINGAFMSRDLHFPDIYIATKNIESTEKSKIDRQIAVIDTILANIHQKEPNRAIQKIDLANLLICTQQSFLTFLAGLPGVGKTSLCRLFTDGQDVKNRFKEVAVSRGWTSQKDLVGFFNPLTNRFQPSQTGLYQFLCALNDEMKKGNKDNPMAYILLDEANLSPIEHYWATFMGMTDNKKNMTLQLGQDIIKVPDYLRFIATINYDSTTEPLSPRIIDRAPIIVLGGDIVDFKEIIEESLYDLPINAKNLEELFGLSSKSENFDDSELQIFKNIQDELNKSDRDLGRPIHLSARKENSIKQYCFQARAIMRHLNLNQDNSDVIALDYAVLQFVLPQVKGNGNKFKKRLESLLNIFQDNKLKKSADYLEHMIRYGEDELHTYDFFCW